MEFDFDPEGAIEISTPNKKIKITGRDLEKLYDFLASFRVRYIQADPGGNLKDEGLLIKEIIIEEL